MQTGCDHVYGRWESYCCLPASQILVFLCLTAWRHVPYHSYLGITAC